MGVTVKNNMKTHKKLLMICKKMYIHRISLKQDSIEKLTKVEYKVIMYFNKNYSTKYNTEIQLLHFGSKCCLCPWFRASMFLHLQKLSAPQCTYRLGPHSFYLKSYRSGCRYCLYYYRFYLQPTLEQTGILRI